MKTKEQTYDDEINALMARIIEICQREKIAMVASFAIPTEDDPELYCSTSLPDETGELPDLIKRMRAQINRFSGGLAVHMEETLPNGQKRLTAFVG